MPEKPKPGTVAWRDLTVADAPGIRDFYSRVVGWTASPVDMGGYEDFNMIPSGDDEPAGGICHARGANAEVPPVWMIYIVVENLDRSLAACRENGGEVLLGPKSMGPGAGYAVIRDPAGAVAALYQMGE